MTQKNLAFLISRILGPIPLLCVLWTVTAFKSGIGFWKAIWVYPVILIFSLLIPTAITTYLIAVKKVSGIEWKDIRSRRKFLVPIGIYSVTILIILSYLLTDGTIFHLTLLFSTIVIAIISIYSLTNFKLSTHTAIATITFATINLFYEQKFLWLFLLLFPIVWARLKLKVHTLSELVGGFILPTVILFLGLLLFGWPKIP